VLEVETRNSKGPRVFDAPLTTFACGQSDIVKERYTFDRIPIVRSEVTVFDHALTRPWIVTKRYCGSSDLQPWWVEDNCMETIVISASRGNRTFSAPTERCLRKKGQRPPHLRYFDQPRK
jgi:hypothetical protein